MCSYSGRAGARPNLTRSVQHNTTTTGLCVNADTYEEEGDGEEPPDQLVHGAAAAQAQAQQHRPFDVGVLGQYDFRLRPTNFMPGFKTLRAPAILDYVCGCAVGCFWV